MKKLFLLTALFVAAAFPSCSKHDNVETPDWPEPQPLAIAFAEGNSLQFDVGETKTVHYTITGGSGNTVVQAEMQNPNGAYTVETTPTSATEGTITITAKTPTDNCVIVTVSDGSQTLTAEIAVSTKPIPEELAITFAEGNSLLLNINEPKTVNYTITGGSGNTVVQAEMQNPNGAYTVETTPTSATEGTITITAKTPTDNCVIVTVSDGSQTLTAEIAVTLRAFDGKTVVVVTPGTLSQLLANYDESSITELTVIGNLNDEDIATLKSLPNLAILDMEHVNLEALPANAFRDKTLLTSVKLPLTLKTIGDFAFYHCYSLTNVTIPDSVTEIGAYAFSGCSSLTSVTIPNSLTEIENDAFYACSSLTSVTIPNSVMTIGERAFSGCSGLKSVTIPDSVTEIGYHAFYNCSSLSAFYGRFASSDNRCLIIDNKLIAFTPVGLTAYTIPNSVTTIGNYVFTDCVGLTSITIPDNVTEIEYGAFSGCSGLKSVTIPDSVTEIGYGAFSGCSGLKSVTIPDSVTKIGDGTFFGCSSLTNVTIPDSVTEIGKEAFRGCSLTSVTIGNGVTSIGSYAFYNCSGLTSVYCKAIAPPSIVNDTFDKVSATATLYVPTGSKAAYAAAAGWKNFKTIEETQF